MYNLKPFEMCSSVALSSFVLLYSYHKHPFPSSPTETLYSLNNFPSSFVIDVDLKSYEREVDLSQENRKDKEGKMKKVKCQKKPLYIVLYSVLVTEFFLKERPHSELKTKYSFLHCNLPM
jgi:hypothetical protein